MPLPVLWGRTLVLADQEMFSALSTYLDDAQTACAALCPAIAPLLGVEAVLAGDHEILQDALASLLDRAADTWRSALEKVLTGEPLHRHATVLSEQAPVVAGAGARCPAVPVRKAAQGRRPPRAVQGLHVGIEKRGERPDDDWVGLRTLVKVESESLEAGEALPDTWAMVTYRQEEARAPTSSTLAAATKASPRRSGRRWTAGTNHPNPPS